MIKLPRDELDFLKKQDDGNESKKEGNLLLIICIYSFNFELIN